MDRLIMEHKRNVCPYLEILNNKHSKCYKTLDLTWLQVFSDLKHIKAKLPTLLGFVIGSGSGFSIHTWHSAGDCGHLSRPLSCVLGQNGGARRRHWLPLEIRIIWLEASFGGSFTSKCCTILRHANSTRNRITITQRELQISTLLLFPHLNSKKT